MKKIKNDRECDIINTIQTVGNFKGCTSPFLQQRNVMGEKENGEYANKLKEN